MAGDQCFVVKVSDQRQRAGSPNAPNNGLGIGNINCCAARNHLHPSVIETIPGE